MKVIGWSQSFVGSCQSVSDTKEVSNLLRHIRKLISIRKASYLDFKEEFDPSNVAYLTGLTNLIRRLRAALIPPLFVQSW